jgi:hypothetical protein
LTRKTMRFFLQTLDLLHYSSIRAVEQGVTEAELQSVRRRLAGL